MKLLVDTCTFLWLVADHPRLSPAARHACGDSANLVYLSSLSAFEIAIKYRLGRLPLPDSPRRYVVAQREALRIESIPLDEAAAVHEALLPQHHRDPFDRGLIAQAIVGGLTIVTPDDAFSHYPAPLLW